MRVGLMAFDLEADSCIKADVLGMWTSLRRRGVESYLFTSTGESSLPLRTMHYADMWLRLQQPDDLLIYHCRSPQDRDLQEIRRLQCRVAVRYHSDLPSKLLIQHSASLVRRVRRGQELLFELSEAPVCAWLTDCKSDSAGLLQQGIHPDDLVCLPPFRNTAGLIDLPDHSGIMASLAGAAFNILAVGALHPGAGYEVMFESFARSLATGRVDLKLHVVGSHDPQFRNYIDRLASIIDRHAMGEYVVLYGDVSASAYATLLRHCNVFWTASQLDAFEFPVVDALAFGLPVLAARTATHTETCGEAAVYADTYHDFAAALDDLANDGRDGARLGQCGLRRYDAMFQEAVIDQRFELFIKSLGTGTVEEIPASSLDASGAWFGMPGSKELIHLALAVSDPLPQDALKGRDRRLDFIDWILREGWQRSVEIKTYLSSADFVRYSAQIRLPPGTAHFTPAMRLVWSFCRFANATFRLRSPDSIQGYGRWFAREATTRYGPFSGV